MVAVAYRVWSITRGSNCEALTGKILVSWIGGRLWEVVEHGDSTVHVNRARKNSWPVVQDRQICFLDKGPGARFSKVPIINGPDKLLPFTLKTGVTVVLHLT